MRFIAIYHLSIKIISRGKGKSAVAAAAYRAGEKIVSAYDGLIHDYTHKGGVVHTEMLLPENAPEEYRDRSMLWNAVEKVEKSRNAQLAREIELALPVELSFEQNLALVRAYCQQHFVSAGMCADLCIHDKGDGNPHAHIMLTMRPFNKDRTWGAKHRKEYLLDRNGQRSYDPKKRRYKSNAVSTTGWNAQTKAEEWRQGWADLVNLYLEQNNVAERVDHRSFKRQGVEQIPTIHLGIAAFQMERKGIITSRGDHNREVALNNRVLSQLRARISKLKKQLDEWTKEAGMTDDPTNPIPSIDLVESLAALLYQPQEKSRYRKVANLKTVASAIGFLQKNSIGDMAGLQEKVAEIRGRFDDVSDKLKKAERRMKVLDTHIQNARNFHQCRGVYQEYMRQKPGKQAAFFEQHHAEIVLYESSSKYLHKAMNGRKGVPLKTWRAEAAALTLEKEKLSHEYRHLKEEVREVEVIRRSVEQALRNEPSKKLEASHQR